MRLPLLIMILNASLAVAGPPSKSQDEPASGKVLVLDNDRTLEGDIDKLGDQYRVRRSVGITWVPVERAARLCKDKVEALAFLRKRANLQDPDERLRLARWCHLQGLSSEALVEARVAVELKPDHAESQRLHRYLEQAVRVAAEKKKAPAAPEKTARRNDPPPITINSESLTQFAIRVQPILMNACAKCHAASGHESAFRLERSNGLGLANRRAIQVNLAAVLGQLQAQLDRSPLLVKAVSAHGSTTEAPLSGRQAEALHILEDWARVTLANNPHLRDALRPPPQMVVSPGPTKPAPEPSAREIEPSRPSKKAPVREADPLPQAEPVSKVEEPPASEEEPENEADPYAPSLFNRQMHPDRVAPSSVVPRKNQ